MIHQNRRKELLSQLGETDLVILSTNPEQIRNGDVHFPFRADSDFFYLSGFCEPESVMVLTQNQYTIFLRDRDPEREIWDGKRLGVKQAPNSLLADQALPIGMLKAKLPEFLSKATKVYFDSRHSGLDCIIDHCVEGIKTHSLKPIVHEMRLIKDTFEIEQMQQAVDVAILAHEKAMQKVMPNQTEYEVQAIFDSVFTQNQAKHSYMPIVAGGKNACVLHYIENSAMLKNGDLLLIDAGCEINNYASDITRTYPINGRFSNAQKKIYQIVLDAQYAAIECIKPGELVSAPHKVASQVIKNGLVELGILQEDGELSDFYMHGTGHWLGLDVHDVGEYKQADSDRVFQKGMVTTVEPGIYIRKNDKIDPVYWNIGIRIEDDVLVTETGNRVLSAALVKEIDEIENLMDRQ